MKKLIMCVALLLCFSSLNALITQWTGDVDTNWASSLNWTDGVPDVSHSAIIPSVVTSGNWPNHSSGNSPCNELANYGTLTITGGTINTNYDFITGSGSQTTLSGYGAINYGQVEGDFEANGTVNISDNALVSGNDFTANPGSIVNVNGGWLSIDGDFNADGTVNVGDASVYTTNLYNGGTITQTDGEVNVTQNLENNGTYARTGGELNVNDTFTNSGSYNSTVQCTLSANFLLNNSTGDFEDDGGDQTIQTVTNAGSIELYNTQSGELEVINFDNEGTYKQSGGTVSINGTFTNSSTGSLELYNNLTGKLEVIDFDNSGSCTQSSGTIDVSGGFSNTYSGSTTISGGTLQVGSADLDGNFNQSGGTVTVDNGFSVDETGSYHQSDGVLNLRGDATFHGTLINTGSTGEVNFNGGGAQVVTNTPAYPVSNIVPSVVVNNGSSVTFDEMVSFYCDNLSVESATLRLNSAYVEEKTAGSGTLNLDGGTLELGGNNNLPDFHNTSFNSASKVIYNSTTHSQEISPANYGKLEVSGTPKYIENGDVNVGNEFILNATVVDIRDNDLTIQDGGVFTMYGDCWIATTGLGSLILENVDSGFFPIGPDLTNFNGFSFDNNGVALNSIGARVETGINPTHPNAFYCLQRTWNIIKDGVLNASFTFQWLQTQETQPFEQARTNSRIVGQMCHTPPSWQVVTTPSGVTGTGIISDPYEFDMDNMVLVSGFCVGDGDHTLPVTLSSFYAVYTNDAGLDFIQVNWSTATETDVHGFNVYKSETDVFDDAYMINPSLIYGQGTTTLGYDYSFDDLDANTEVRNYYWVEQVDFSGVNELFGPAVYIPDGNNDPGSEIFTETKVLQQYPNPVKNNLKIEYQIKGSEEQQDAIIYIYNMKGEFVDILHGRNGTANIDLSDYATGVYFYRLHDTTLGEIYKFVVIR